MIMHQDCAVIPYFGATFGEEFDRANAGDVGLFGARHTLIIIYAAMALGKRDYVHFGMGIACHPIVTILLSIAESYGFAGAWGIIFTPLSASLLTNFVSVFPQVKKHSEVFKGIYIWYY